MAQYCLTFWSKNVYLLLNFLSERCPCADNPKRSWAKRPNLLGGAAETRSNAPRSTLREHMFNC